jgi:hypothetical protein
MHKVEPSGVVLHGVCDIQTAHCTAKAGGAITAVWGPPGRTQINVCRACLEEKMRCGEWVVEGARLRQRLQTWRSASRNGHDKSVDSISCYRTRCRAGSCYQRKASRLTGHMPYHS